MSQLRPKGPILPVDSELGHTFEILLDQLSDAVILFDSAGVIHRVNPEFTRLLKFESEEVTGRSYVDISLCVHESDFNTLLERVRQSGAVNQQEHLVRDREGNQHRCLIHASRIEAEGEERLIVFMRSLDDLDTLQQQLYQAQKMEEVGRLTGAVAHDLNNILTVILGNISYAELLTSSNLASIDDLVRIRNEVKLATERAVGVTGQLLAFSRKQFMEIKTVDVKALLEEAGRMMHHLIAENIDFDLELTEEPVKHVAADPMLIQQVLLNLSVNAVHAMPMGGKLKLRLEMANGDAAVKCTLCNSEVSGEFVTIVVEDEGVGIPPEMITKIFDPFFTTKEAGKGTGLGLSTVANILSRHKGHVHVESEPGRGSRFSIYLPTSDGQADEVRKPDRESEGLPTGSERVLVIDDDITIRRLISNLLRSRGYQVETIADGRDAVDRCGGDLCEYDLLITDVMMPGINGLEIASKVRELNPKMKILCISGYIESTELMDEVERNRYPMLAKPFNSMQLLLKVREVLEAPIRS